MTTRSNPASAGFDWLKRGVGLSVRHPGPMFGGAALLLVVGLIPSLVTLPIQFNAMRTNTPPSTGMVGLLFLVSLVIGLLILPLYAGFMQVIRAVDQGQPTRVGGIFGPYRHGQAGRLIGFGVLMIVIYLVLLAIAFVLTSGGIIRWYMQTLAAQANHLPPPGVPAGFGITMLLFTLIGLFMIGFYAISLGQVALTARSVFGAIADGAAGAFKNALPLLIMALLLAVAWLVVGIAIAIVAIVLTLIAKLVGAWLALVVLVPLYIALLLVIFAVMFGVMYAMWRDVSVDGVPGVPGEPMAA